MHATPSGQPTPSRPASGRTQLHQNSTLKQRTARILVATVRAFFADNVTRLGAALAFYTTIAVAPLLVLTLAVAGLMFDEAAARRRVIGEVEQLVGAQAGALIASIRSPVASTSGTIATLIGVGSLIFGALGVFHHLQGALNAIWRVQPRAADGWRVFVRRRLFSLATVLVSGFLLLVSLVMSAVLSWLGARTVERLGLPIYILQAGNELLSLGIVTFLFAMIFKLLPDTRVPWRHVWLGAAVTALLFTAGKGVLGFYLGRTTLTSAFGAAGSLVALLLWSYYAAQIVFFGAEFTRVATLSDGGRNAAPLAAAQRHRGPRTR